MTQALQRPELSNTVALMGLVQLAASDRRAAAAKMIATPDGERREWHIFVANTGEPNRYSDIIDQATWQLENYQRNPVILWMHDLNRQPLGRGEVWIEGEGTPTARLMVKVSWDLAREDAREVARQVEEGFLSAVSISAAFAQAMWRSDLPEGDPRFKATGWGRVLSYGDLREVSIVTVPGDANALRQALLAALGDPPAPSPAPPASTTPNAEVSMLRTLMLAALAFAPAAESTDEQIADAAESYRKRAELAEGAVRKTLSLPADAPIPADVEARLAAATDKTGLISLTEAATLLSAATSAGPSAAELCKAQVTAAVKAGTLAPAVEAHFCVWAEKDPAGCSAALAKLGPAIPLASQVSTTAAATAAAQGGAPAPLSAEAQAVCKQLGLSEAEYRASERGELPTPTKEA